MSRRLHARGGLLAGCTATLIRDQIMLFAANQLGGPSPEEARPLNGVPRRQAQGLLSRVKAAGGAVLPVWVAWKPNDVEAPGAIVEL
ncbi:hypothetical protein [Nonomuraea sp. NPDC049758]|uniref:hypothetical protein n=1 Tax=Nonomuraea sp. NPDC049758 TaxID=3154360 RepID=UPI0034272661